MKSLLDQEQRELLPRLRELLTQRPGRDNSLARLSARGIRFRDSAVLLPIVLPEPEAPPATSSPPELLFIVRHAGLPTHSGQVAFPGGKREPTDATLEETALRESHEEIGLLQERVAICGLLDDVPTTAGFSITPLVGIVQAPLTLSLSATEVSEVFTVPLDALAAGHRIGFDVAWEEVTFLMHEFHYRDERGAGPPQNRLIWGATARITYQLLVLLGLLPPSPEA